MCLDINRCVKNIAGLTGYPIWLWVWYQLGVPQRIAIELLWIFVSFFGAMVVYMFTKKIWHITVIFFVMSFFPATYLDFDMAYTDNFYLCLVLASLFLFIVYLNSNRSLQKLLLIFCIGAVSSIMNVTRNECIIIYLSLFICGLSRLVIDVNVCKNRFKASFFSFIFFISITLPMASSARYIFIEMNKIYKNVGMLSLPDMPSHLELLYNLASIDTGEINPRRVPISKKARALAYSVSKTLKRVAPLVEDPHDNYQQVTLEFLGITGEVGGGWIWHTFNTNVSKILSQKNKNVLPRDLDAFYQQANRELAAAFGNGTLKKKFVIHPLLGSTLQSWVPYLGKSFIDLLERMHEQVRYPQEWHENNELFDVVCLRRKALISANCFISGWVFSTAKNIPVTEISASIKNRYFSIPLKVKFTSRKDVVQKLSNVFHDIPEYCGFTVEIKNMPYAIPPELIFKSNNVEICRYTPTDHNAVADIYSENNHFLIGIDQLNIEPSLGMGWRKNLTSYFVNIYRSNNSWIFLCSIGAFSYGIVIFRSRYIKKYFIISVSFGCILIVSFSRLAFYSIIDAAAWWAEPRYLMSVSATIYYTSFVFILFAAEMKNIKINVCRK